jgi:hypothetical protein
LVELNSGIEDRDIHISFEGLPCGWCGPDEYEHHCFLLSEPDGFLKNRILFKDEFLMLVNGKQKCIAGSLRREYCLDKYVYREALHTGGW